MKIDHKVFYAIILALLLNECKIAGCITNRVDPDQMLRFCPSVPSQFALLEKFSVSLAHPVFKYPLHERTSGLSDTEWPALPVSPASRSSASFATAVSSVHVAKTSYAKSLAVPSVRYVFGQTGLSKQCRPR